LQWSHETQKDQVVTLSIQSLTKAADMGTVALAVISGLSVGISLFYVLWHALKRRHRGRRFPGGFHPPAMILDLGSDGGHIYDFKKSSEATSSDDVKVFPLKIEKRKTSSNQSIQVEGPHG
jgi:hypothetical protein